MIGKACCTFILAETDDGHSIAEALDQLLTLQKGMSQDPRPKDFDLFSWLTSGPWYQIILKFLTPVLIILILFCIFTSCIFPCIRSQITKMISINLSKEMQILLAEQTQEESDKDYDSEDEHV